MTQADTGIDLDDTQPSESSASPFGENHGTSRPGLFQRSWREVGSELAPTATVDDLQRYQRRFRQHAVQASDRGFLAILPPTHPLVWVGLVIVVQSIPPIALLIIERNDLLPDDPESQFVLQVFALGWLLLGLSMMFAPFWGKRHGLNLLMDREHLVIRHAGKMATIPIEAITSLRSGFQRCEHEVLVHFDLIDYKPSGGVWNSFAIWRHPTEQPITFIAALRPDLQVSTGVRKPPKRVPNRITIFAVIMILVLASLVTSMAIAALVER